VNGVLHEETLILDPAAISARNARAFLGRLLSEADRERWLEAAQLAVSEVVTNGVLHAHTTLRLTAHVSEDELRVEVYDANPQLPLQRSAQEGTTGRGMELVAAVVAECGVHPVPPVGKVVWFVVRDGQQEPAVDDLLARWDVEDLLEPPPSEGLDATVVLAGLPPTLWLAAHEHHTALLREYFLYAAEHDDTEPVDVARADEARGWVSKAVLRAIDEDRQAAPDRPLLPTVDPSAVPALPPVLDVALTVPHDGQASMLALQDALDAAERLAIADRLLIRPGLPEIVAVRDWVCDSIVAQLGGVEASAWPGTAQERFTVEVNDRDTPAPSWDVSIVRDADRGVVAADEANRIVAVSRPLADALGWEVDDLVGRRVVALVPPALREAHVAGFSRHLTTGRATLLGAPLQLPVLHHDGHEMMCDFVIEHAPDSGTRPVYLAWITPAR
jgi:PAS domain S-box-containing protein